MSSPQLGLAVLLKVVFYLCNKEFNYLLLLQIYSDFTDVVTVKMGTDNGPSEFFKIDRYRGQSQLPGYDPDVSEHLDYKYLI